MKVKSRFENSESIPAVPDTEYKIVKYRPEFRNQVLELQKHHWGSNHSLNSDYMEWKYEHNPYMSSPHIYLALHSGKAIGMRGFFGTKWQAGNPRRTYILPSVGDSVIEPLTLAPVVNE